MRVLLHCSVYVLREGKAGRAAAKVTHGPMLQDEEGRLLSRCQGSRLVTQWSWVCGVYAACEELLLDHFRKSKMPKSSGMERGGLSLFPLEQNESDQIADLHNRGVKFCLGFSFHLLLALAPSPKEQRACRLRMAKCMLSTASVLRGRVCQWCTKLFNQLVRQ